MANLAEGNGVQGTTVMPQLHRAYGDLLYRPFYLTNVDVLAPPEGIVDQEEQAGDDVLNQLL